MRTLRCLRSVASTYSFLSSTGAHAAAQLGQGLTLVPALSAMQTLIASKQLLVWGPGTTLATFSTQLSRVPFTTASMDSSSNPLKTLLGCSEDQLQRMTRLYPGYAYCPASNHSSLRVLVLLTPLTNSFTRICSSFATPVAGVSDVNLLLICVLPAHALCHLGR